MKKLIATVTSSLFAITVLGVSPANAAEGDSEIIAGNNSTFYIGQSSSVSLDFYVDEADSGLVAGNDAAAMLSAGVDWCDPFYAENADGGYIEHYYNDDTQRVELWYYDSEGNEIGFTGLYLEGDIMESQYGNAVFDEMTWDDLGSGNYNFYNAVRIVGTVSNIVPAGVYSGTIEMDYDSHIAFPITLTIAEGVSPTIANGYRADALGSVYFAPGSSKLSKAAQDQLKALVTANPTAIYKVTGYVQKSGTSVNDAKLSLARAKSVESYLASLGAGVTFNVVVDTGLVPAKEGTSAKARKATLFAMTPVVQ